MERRVPIFRVHPLSPDMHSLCYITNIPSTVVLCCNWTHMDPSESPKVHSLPHGSFLAFCILWVWKNVTITCIHHEHHAEYFHCPKNPLSSTYLPFSLQPLATTYPFTVIMLLLIPLSHFSRVRLCATPSLGFSRKEHWSGLPFPFPMNKSEKWTFGLCGRRRGWDVSREQHRNMYII